MLFWKSELKKWLKLENLKKIRKDQFLIILLSGLLLLIIGIPTKDKDESKVSDETMSLFSKEKGTFVENKDDVTLHTTETNTSSKETEVTMQEAREYVSALESKLEETLSYIEAAGRVKVIVTIKSGILQTVDKDTTDIYTSNVEEDASGGKRTTSEGETTKETVYLSNEDGAKEPYVIHESVPQVEGIVVICEGGDSSVVKSEITQAMQALFPLEAHKIRVIRMQRNNSMIEGDDSAK